VTRSAKRVLFISMVLLLFGAVAAQAKTKITVLLYDTRQQAENEDAVARFNRDHPDVEAELLWVPSGQGLTKLRTMVAGGVPPDIYVSDGSNSMFATLGLVEGILIDLTPYVEANAAHFKDWFPGILEMGQLLGKQWGIPMQNLNTYATFYNIDHFNEVGLPMPTNSWTWSDFRNIALKLTRDINGDGRIDRFAYYEDWYTWRSWLENAGGTVFDPTGRKIVFDSEASRAGLQFLYQLRWIDHVLPQPGEISGRARDRFVDGTISMVHRQGLYWQSIEAVNLTAGAVLDPIGPDPARKTMGAIQYFAITSGSKHPDLAFELIKYLTDETSAKMATETGALPVHARIARDYFGRGVGVANFRDVMIDTTAYNLFNPVHFYPGGTEIDRLVADTTVNGKLSISAAMDTYIPLAQKALDEFWEEAAALMK